MGDDLGCRTDGRDHLGPITADGCPVEIYRMLPAMGEPELIHSAIAPGSLVLDLGAGTGRIADALVALGHTVVAVDNSPDMLAAITRAAPVLADVETFRDVRRFDAVVLASHLVNTPDDAKQDALLATVSHHLRPTGTAFVEWHPPEWFDSLTAGATYTGTVGLVESRLHVKAMSGGLLDAEVGYALDGRSWTQPFTARRLIHRELSDALGRAGLALVADSPYRGDWILAVSRTSSR